MFKKDLSPQLIMDGQYQHARDVQLYLEELVNQQIRLNNEWFSRVGISLTKHTHRIIPKSYENPFYITIYGTKDTPVPLELNIPSQYEGVLIFIEHTDRR